jgi:hypothetical protein
MLPGILAGTTYYVATNGSDSASGQGGWANALLSISNGVFKAGAGDTVLVSNGEYAISAAINITKGIALTNFSGIRENTIINGQNLARPCLIVSYGSARVSGFTIENGTNYSWVPGANLILNTGLVDNCTISNANGSAASSILGGTLSNCWVANNNTVGMYLGDSNATVINCLISNNLNGAVNSQGGGIVMNAGVLQNCTIVANQATNGSAGGGVAVLNVKGNINISDCVVNGNYASTYGGGLYCYRPTTNSVTVYHCVFSNNFAVSVGGCLGGGCYFDSSTIASGMYVTADRLIVVSNYVNYWGGGVYVAGSNITVRNSLIANNVAGNAGGGLIFYGDISSIVANCTIVSNYASKPHIYGSGYPAVGLTMAYTNGVCYNTIVWSNFSNPIFGLPLDDTCNSNWDFYNCCSPNLSGQNNITNHPAFNNFASGDYHLPKNSPCVNAGTNQDWMNGAVDLDQHGRIDHFQRIVDMGCFEYLFSGMMFTAP